MPPCCPAPFEVADNCTWLWGFGEGDVWSLTFGGNCTLDWSLGAAFAWNIRDNPLTLNLFAPVLVNGPAYVGLNTVLWFGVGGYPVFDPLRVHITVTNEVQLDPEGHEWLIVLDSTVPAIRGIKAPPEPADGREMLLTSAAPTPWQLTHEDLAAAPADRILCTGQGPGQPAPAYHQLDPKESLPLRYDGQQSRWRALQRLVKWVVGLGYLFRSGLEVIPGTGIAVALGDDAAHDRATLTISNTAPGTPGPPGPAGPAGPPGPGGGVTSDEGNVHQGAYNCTSSYASAGLSHTFAATGDYKITVTVQTTVNGVSAGTAITIKLRNVTAGSDLMTPDYYAGVVQVTGLAINTTTTLSVIASVTAGDTIELQAKFLGAPTTAVVGGSWMDFVRVA